MSKVVRPRIPRGGKLYREHTGVPLVAVSDELEGTVGGDNLKEGMGSFWIGPLTIPVITSTFSGRGRPAAGVENAYLIPFLIPPLRDSFDTEGDHHVSNSSTGSVTLDAISFGFDTRDEKAPISDHRTDVVAGSVNYPGAGKLNYDTAPSDAYRISIALFQKEQYFFQDSATKSNRGVTPKDRAYGVGSEIWRYDFSGLELLMEQGKPNPFIAHNIGIELDRYATYTIAIYCNSLGVPSESAGSYNTFALVGATVGIRCLHPLVRADLATNVQFGPLGVQNHPVKTGGNLTVNVVSPGVGDVIEADNATSGISESMGTLDEVAQNGIRGGCSREGEQRYNKSIQTDACYEVIAVPLMQNRARGGIGSYSTGIMTSDIVREPYINSTGINGNATGNILQDIRIIPIKAPMTIHNIFLAWSWDYFLQETDTPTTNIYDHIPSSATMLVTIGVGIGEGIGSDNVNYQQVARHALTEPINPAGSGEPGTTWDGGLVDRIESVGLLAGPIRLAANISLWGHEIHQIPLLGDTSPPAAYSVGTYYPQGEPFCISRAWTGTGDYLGGAATRTEVNRGGSTAPAYTGGRETFIEVRLQITDSDAGTSLIDYGATLDKREVVSGYGGHWLYIIGKKQLVGDY